MIYFGQSQQLHQEQRVRTAAVNTQYLIQMNHCYHSSQSTSVTGRLADLPAADFPVCEMVHVIKFQWTEFHRTKREFCPKISVSLKETHFICLFRNTEVGKCRVIGWWWNLALHITFLLGQPIAKFNWNSQVSTNRGQSPAYTFCRIETLWTKMSRF